MNYACHLKEFDDRREKMIFDNGMSGVVVQ